MAMVRFASVCDVKAPKCLGRSEEYTEWPDCRSCGLSHVCTACAVPGSLQESDRDRSDGEITEAVHSESVICTNPECEGEYRDELAAQMRSMAQGA